MENNIKVGCCYKTKEDGWIIVNARHDNYFTCHDIIIDSYGYDEEISEMTEKQIKDIIASPTCYRPYYHRKYGLYKVWDEENKPHSEAIILQNIGL